VGSLARGWVYEIRRGETRKKEKKWDMGEERTQGWGLEAQDDRK